MPRMTGTPGSRRQYCLPRRWAKSRGSSKARSPTEAAILYTLAYFGTPPAAYKILRDDKAEVYRYPE